MYTNVYTYSYMYIFCMWGIWKIMINLSYRGRMETEKKNSLSFCNFRNN